MKSINRKTSGASPRETYQKEKTNNINELVVVDLSRGAWLTTPDRILARELLMKRKRTSNKK